MLAMVGTVDEYALHTEIGLVPEHLVLSDTHTSLLTAS